MLYGLAPEDALRFNLADPQERSRHLANPGEFAQACRSFPANKKGQFVFVDEAQSVPSIFDAVQSLYDADKTRWRSIRPRMQKHRTPILRSPFRSAMPGATSITSPRGICCHGWL